MTKAKAREIFAHAEYLRATGQIKITRVEVDWRTKPRQRIGGIPTKPVPIWMRQAIVTRMYNR